MDSAELVPLRGETTFHGLLPVELKFNLDQYVNKRYPGLVKIVRNSRREGLIRARLQGWKAATAPVVGFFDAHVEFNTGWAEPALSRIREDRRRIVLPAIDNIKYSTFEVQQYRLWLVLGGLFALCRVEAPEPVNGTVLGRSVASLPGPVEVAALLASTLFYSSCRSPAPFSRDKRWGPSSSRRIPGIPVKTWRLQHVSKAGERGKDWQPGRTPAMIGCSFVVDREYFGDIGLLDPGMEVYGGENVELGMRTVMASDRQTATARQWRPESDHQTVMASDHQTVTTSDRKTATARQ
ncbi:PREDICTED: uncharacterized protein LOC105541283 [Mandrillus leucophaeus]|uniref:uncharacterized protein LOC105541283 n=1 Tax=Mandrillus leucophaeus TaxID=9568 RepID=UPI0005F4FF0A|nr:PREDICTED: uncharacterized protein LOC105541283 [Mandrillus leucophaeus]